MSSSKKIRNRLDKLFDGINEPEIEDTAPVSKKIRSASAPVPTTPLSMPNKTLHTGPLSPAALEIERTVTMTQVNTDSSSTVMSVPFQTGDEWNLIQLEQNVAHPWKDEQKSLVQQVADQLGLALQNARLFEETQKSALQMTAVAEIATSITSILDLQQLLETAVHLTQRRFGLYHAHIFLPEKDNQLLVVKACGWQEGDVHEGTHGTREIEINAPVSIVAKAAREKRAIVDNNVHIDPNWLPNPLLPYIQSEMAIPVILGNRLLGILNIHSEKINFFTKADLTIMTTLATQIASAMDNARLFTERKTAETTLAAERNLLTTLIENIPDNIFAKDSESRVIMDNIAHRRTLGVTTLEEVVGKTDYDFFPQELAALFVADEQEIIRSGKSLIEKEEPGLGRDGSQKWLLTTKVPLRDLEGKITGIVGINHDITERKKAEETLIKFQLGIQQSQDATFITDIQGTILFINPAFEKIYGYTSDEAIGKTPRILKSGVIPQERYTEFWHTLLNKQPVTGELVNKTKDGRLIPIEGANTPIIDNAGNMIGFLGVHRDISERKKIEAALQQNEEALRRQNEYLSTATEVGRLITSTLDLDTLFNRAVELIKSRFGYYFVSIFTVDPSGFNAVLREGTGLVGEEMKARKHTLSVGSKSIIGTVTAEGSTMAVNDTGMDPIHRPNPLLPETRAETGIPLKIGSRVLGALDIQAKEINAFHPEDIAVLETLSDQIAVALDNANSYDLAQKAVAEMRELDRIKSQFLANMSHELRTPLNSIIGFSRVILKGIDGPVSEQQHQDLSAIYNSGQHLLGLINDILDLSKIEAGKMELSLEELNIADTANSVMSTALGLVKDKPIKLKSDIDPSIPTVRADPMRIRQVLLNLISNAAKFTDEGSITLSAHVQTGPRGIQEIQVNVTDTGNGISPEDQLKLFQAFSQVDASPTRKTGGSGLGLSICQRMIELHGGKIGVNSAVGKGSTFYFSLPLYHQPEIRPTTGEGRKILCIDDDPQVISLYERYLQPQGYTVIPVANAVNAKDTAKRVKPYAITLDIMMPDVDGWTVLEQLKNDPETRNIPVIICSIVEEEEKGFSIGAADYLVKPILEEDLVLSLNRLNGDGAIKQVLIIDDSLDDLRLMEKILTEHSTFQPVTAEGGEKGWDIITKQTPDAVILDLFMPELDGFTILERLRTTPELRDLPVVVVSGMDLTSEQKKQLENLGKHMLQKGLLDQNELFSTLEKALKRLESH